MAEADIGAHELRRSWSAGEPRRADAGLRRFGRQVGDAVMCPTCDGDGVVLSRARREPIKCPECKGEGLDPKVQHGGRGEP